MSRKSFVDEIKNYVIWYTVANNYNENVIDAIIAQACVESNNGASLLSAKYHNYFGMKCGSSYKGNGVNLRTKEVYNGRVVNIKDMFRAYSDMDEGVRGYFDFISMPRYAKLRSCTTAEAYIKTLKSCGYATSPVYVSTLTKVLKEVRKIRESEKITNSKNFVVGRQYKLLYNMRVHVSDVITSRSKTHNELTMDGKRHDKDCNGTLDKGTVITCKQITYCLDGHTMVRCPSGWICAVDSSGKVYME